jgi:hypothetical protein
LNDKETAFTYKVVMAGHLVGTQLIYEHHVPGLGLENREYPQRLALTSSISGGRLVGIIRSRTQATEFVCFSTRTGTEYTNNTMSAVQQ